MLSQLRHSERSEESHPVEILRRSAPQDDEVRFMSRMTMHAGESLIYLDTHELILLSLRGTNEVRDEEFEFTTERFIK